MKKRSILISMLVIGVVAALIAAATTATFSDQVNSSGNTFKAGTLYMTSSGTSGSCDGHGKTAGNYGADSTPTAIGGSGGADQAGDTGCNTGTVSLVNGLAAGNGQTDASCVNMAPGDTCTGTGFSIKNSGSLNGELWATLAPVANTLPTNCAASNWTVSFNGKTLTAGGGAVDLGALTSGSSTATGGLSVTLSNAAGNACQGAGASAFNLVFNLYQS